MHSGVLAIYCEEPSSYETVFAVHSAKPSILIALASPSNPRLASPPPPCPALLR